MSSLVVAATKGAAPVVTRLIAGTIVAGETVVVIPAIPVLMVATGCIVTVMAASWLFSRGFSGGFSPKDGGSANFSLTKV